MSFLTGNVSSKLQQVLRCSEHQMEEALKKDQELRDELISCLAQASISELSEWIRNHRLLTATVTSCTGTTIIEKTRFTELLSEIQLFSRLDLVTREMAQQNWPPAFTTLLTNLRDEILKCCTTDSSFLMNPPQNTESEIPPANDELIWMTGMVRLLNTLCSQLDTVVLWLNSQDVAADTARKQYMERYKILRFVQMVEKNIEKAHRANIKGAAPFSVQGLRAIIQSLHADMDAIMSKAKAGARPVTLEIPFDQLSTTQDIAHAVENLFGNQVLSSAVQQKLKKAGSDETTLMSLMRDFVHLADEAIHAPDYAKTQNGSFHPVSRTGYRNRDHDPFTLWSSAMRQEASKEKLGKRLLTAINNEQPIDAMGQLIRNSFIEEIGLDAALVQDWTVEMTAVQEAIRANLLLPLRALNETKQNLNKGKKELDPIIHKVVTEITKAVLEGRFREWRYENSKHQLSGLSEKQLEMWKRGTSAALEDLKTREEDDLGLFWVTKVGGPSHGFDRNGNCLLPLLCNSRTKAIMIDDPKYPDAPAARSYIRLVHLKDGSAELFLEPFQRDFPHIEIIGDAPEVNNIYYAAIMTHAFKKAEQMGLPLTIDEYYGEIAESLDVRFEPREAKLLLKASSGIFEASDTLSSKHDWVQMQDELTAPLYRLVFYPQP